MTAAINGIVTDPSGSAVAGATVTATDMDRGTTSKTTTNGSGFYNFPRLPVGRYEVRAQNPGFEAAVRSDILLQLNQNARVDFTLIIGNVSQTVEVTAAPPVLQTQSTQLGTVIDARTNTQLPLASRNYVQLTLLAPGSVHPNPQGFTNGQTTGNGARPYINGNREQANNFLLDGIDNNQVSDNLVGYAPSPDAIQEFDLIEQNASAEFGNFSGGIVSTSIKSGRNAFHGDVFEFFRNDKLNANRWDYNFLGTPRPLLRWNQFGATLGGPIKKDKLFFFVDYEGERLDTPASTSGFSVLTALERQGNFSELLSRGILIRDPRTGIPYRDNIIPASQLSPVAVSTANSQYYPAPINNNLVNNQVNSQQTQTNVNQGDARVDWALSDKDHLLGRYSQSFQEIPATNSQPLVYNSFNNAATHNGVLDWTRTASPSLVNDARFGVNYVLFNTGSASGNLPNLNQTFGIPGVPSNILTGISFPANGFISGIGNSDIYQLFADTVIQYEDTVILTKGSHTMHIGFQGFRQRIDTFYSGNNGLAGTFTFNGQYSGRGESDFLLGLPSSIGTGTNGGTWGQRANIFAGFFQDDWRARPNLTLNLGLRYEIHTPWVEVRNRETNFGLFSGAVEQPGQNGNSDALYSTYNGIGNWQPRIGFAWTPGGGNTVIRAAYTLSTYLEGTGTNLRLTINPPFSSEHNADYTNLSYPATTLDQGYTPITSASSCTEAGLLAASPACFRGVTLRVWDPKFMPALSNQWSFTIQRQFGNSTTFQAGYVGQRGTHLVVPTPYFQRQLLPNGAIVNSPYLGGNPAIQNQIGQISGTASDGNQSYNALQLVFQRRLDHGLSFQANYTWSKCLTDSIGFFGAGGQSAPSSPYAQNLYDRRADYGPCFFDVTHIFSGYATYDLPFGRNRTFGKNLNRWVDAVAGGWQVNAIASFHGGFPLTITANDASGTISRGPRANCIASPVVYGTQNVPAALGGGYQWFSPASYAQPTSGFGSCGVGTVRGPGLNTVDLSASKLFNVTEHQNLEVRGEFINVSNTPILGAPSRSLGSNLGVVNSSQGPRNIQIALKYNF
ncbi:MAG TPA: carboxypeptidase regulatory-like domain-containing protein [Bryobacteraceae bacterium]|nr:carboxypeptidase regulatory-like domain-containing protein [Bryobacteraceae bacterium]